MKIQDIHPIILASKSPRRQDILRAHGVDYIVRPTDTDETLPNGIAPDEAVKLLSLEKAKTCLQSLPNAEFPSGMIVAADTIVYKDEILGKPHDEADAFRMLSSYRGTVHQVMTGVTLIDIASRRTKSFCEVTNIHCKDYTDEDIYQYIRSAKPYDKAGAYGIQEEFSEYIDQCDGDYENVVGLPFERLAQEAEDFMSLTND